MTSIGVRAAAGRAALDLVAGDFGLRVIDGDDRGARVALVATRALLLGDDHVVVEISVGPGAWLDVVEIAGTVAYDADDVPSSWSVRARVAEAASVTWQGEPLVVSDGANVLRRTEVELEEGARWCTREILVLGRSGERGGSLRTRTSVQRAGEPVLIEDLDLTGPVTGDAEHPRRELPGLVGRHRVVDTVTVIGPVPDRAPELAPGQFFEFDADGASCRWLGSRTHESPLAAIYRRWSTAPATPGAELSGSRGR